MKSSVLFAGVRTTYAASRSNLDCDQEVAHNVDLNHSVFALAVCKEVAHFLFNPFWCVMLMARMQKEE